jgi:hypothetical protein
LSWETLLLGLMNAAIVGVAGYFGKTYLEDYKKDISKELVQYNNDISKTLEEHKSRYNFYTERKQKYIFELHEKMYHAYEASTYLNFPLRILPDYQKYREDDIKEVLSKLNILNSVRDEVFSEWKKNPSFGASRISKIHRLNEENTAQRANQEFLNAILKSRLILRDQLYDSLEELAKQLRTLVFFLSDETKREYSNDYSLRKENRKNIEEAAKKAEKIYEQIIFELKEELWQ